MSRMSQAHAELCEQAYALGYKTLEEALDAGYTPTPSGESLILTSSAEEEAHTDLIEERDNLLSALENIKTENKTGKQTINRAIEFIREEVK